MLTLRSSPPSPFGRKVKIAASVLGLSDQISVLTADTNDADDSLRLQNPLGKIPVLVLQNGQTIYDSRVIVEYLDTLSNTSVFPSGDARFTALRGQALADGIMDAALVQVYEHRFRDAERRDAAWISYQAEKVTRGLSYLENGILSLEKQVMIDDIALACALGYLDLRFDGVWRQTHPKLVAWLDAFSDTVPIYQQTAI
ncbi:MAG: glutathione S-transferase family protein [Stappiaceae bacterium]